MRLSEAIRLGAMLKPQGYGRLLDWNGDTCALGAACEAVGIRISVHQSSPNNATFRRWPILRERVESPMTDRHRAGRASVSVTIQSLNDSARWTREQIADWVETLESRSTEVTTAPVADSAEILSVGNR